jgi:large subunit ribosomal protein L19e
MKLEKIRKMSARILKCGVNKVWFNPGETEKIKSVMTTEDLRALVKEGVVAKADSNHLSRGRARILRAKKKKGRKRSFGSRKGLKSARMEIKKKWINRTRALREELKKIQKENPKAVEKIGYRKLYRMINGNFFKGRAYLKSFVEGKKIKEQ